MPEISDLKSIYKGESCFVIGNGPSLNDYDLNKLIDKNVIVTNTFHMHPVWPKLQNVYHVELNGAMWSSPVVSRWKLKALSKNENAKFIVREKFRDLWNKVEYINPWRVYTLKLINDRCINDGYYNWDISKGSVWGNTGVIEGSMASAQYMGFKIIYLLGCDASGFKHRGGYFYDWTKTPEIYHPRESDTIDWSVIMESWNTINKLFSNKGIKIFNLSEDSKIEYFERKDYNEVV